MYLHPDCLFTVEMLGFEGAQHGQPLSLGLLLSRDIQESPLRGSLAPKGDATPGIVAYPLILPKKKKKKSTSTHKKRVQGKFLFQLGLILWHHWT